MKALTTVLVGGVLLLASPKGLSQEVETYTVAAASQQARQEQIDCLATNIYYEARGESERGRLAVGLVTINRAKSNHYPDDLCAVVRQRNQFSWYKPGKIRQLSQSGNKLFHEVREIASMLYDEYYVANKFPDFVGGATHFHHVKVNPRWKGKQQTARIGAHLFFRVNR